MEKQPHPYEDILHLPHHVSKERPHMSLHDRAAQFSPFAALEKQQAAEEAERDREKRLQNAILDIKHKLGKNAILKGMNLEEGATARDRNAQIGGHKA